MIEKDDPPTQRHEFGKDGRVISDKYRRSIEKLRRLVNEFDALVEPEVPDPVRSGVGAADDVPTISPPTGDGFPQSTPVDLETGKKLWYLRPDGSRWLPVERDGHRSWVVFAPQSGVPRVKLWTTNADGRPVVTPGPPTSYFIVRTEKEYDVPMLFSDFYGAIERRYGSG